MSQGVDESFQPLAKVPRCIVIMVEMDFDVPEASVTQVGKAIKKLRFIPLFRKKECVLRGTPIGVGESLCKLRISLNPGGHPLSFYVVSRVPMPRLEMVSDAKEYFCRTAAVSMLWAAKLRGE
jgi:hypothetical protein